RQGPAARAPTPASGTSRIFLRPSTFCLAFVLPSAFARDKLLVPPPTAPLESRSPVGAAPAACLCRPLPPAELGRPPPRNLVMATVAALPPSLRDKLTALARRIRLLRAVRGVSLVALVL